MSFEGASPYRLPDLPEFLRHLECAILLDARRTPGLRSDPYAWAEIWFDPKAACVTTSLRDRIQASRGGLEPVCFRIQARLDDPTADRSLIRIRKRALAELTAWLTPLVADEV
jgi:hypothetical protein